MNARQVHDHLRSLDGGWVDWENTVGTFKAGDRDRELTGIAVGWMSYTWALERALELDCNLFITHEPTYFSHDDAEERIFRFEGVQRKRDWIERSGFAILRCHDLWDQLPGIGIPDSWASLLGFEHPAAGDGYYRLFDVSGRTAQSIAEQVAARTRRFGQEAVQLIGPADVLVSRLALGTGAITPLTTFLDRFDADIAICSDDGFTYWHAGALAIDLGIPVVVVNHAVSELHGMELLTQHLAAQFPQVPVHHIPQRCMYQLIPNRSGITSRTAIGRKE